MSEQKPYIEFQDVRKAFGSKAVLDGVSFNVMPGETVCILGRSGVGKSVSLHLIMGFLKADGGRVHVAYEDITALAIPVLRHRILLNFHAESDRIDSDEILRQLLQHMPPSKA